MGRVLAFPHTVARFSPDDVREALFDLLRTVRKQSLVVPPVEMLDYRKQGTRFTQLWNDDGGVVRMARFHAEDLSPSRRATRRRILEVLQFLCGSEPHYVVREEDALYDAHQTAADRRRNLECAADMMRPVDDHAGIVTTHAALVPGLTDSLRRFPETPERAKFLKTFLLANSTDLPNIRD